MKKEIKLLLAVVLSIICFSCKQKPKSSNDKLPTSVSDIASIKKILIGKQWKVQDIAAVSGPFESKFVNKEDSTQTVAVPKLSNLNWYSQMKGLEDTTDFRIKFTKETYEKYKKISMNFVNDSTLVATGMEATNHTFRITDLVEETEPKGIKLKMTYSTLEQQMGMNKFTATYYVLGVNSQFLYLLSPYKVNREKIVFLLATK